MVVVRQIKQTKKIENDFFVFSLQQIAYVATRDEKKIEQKVN